MTFTPTIKAAATIVDPTPSKMTQRSLLASLNPTPPQSLMSRSSPNVTKSQVSKSNSTVTQAFLLPSLASARMPGEPEPEAVPQMPPPIAGEPTSTKATEISGSFGGNRKNQGRQIDLVQSSSKAFESRRLSSTTSVESADASSIRRLVSSTESYESIKTSYTKAALAQSEPAMRCPEVVNEDKDITASSASSDADIDHPRPGRGVVGGPRPPSPAGYVPPPSMTGSARPVDEGNPPATTTPSSISNANTVSPVHSIDEPGDYAMPISFPVSSPVQAQDATDLKLVEPIPSPVIDSSSDGGVGSCGLPEPEPVTVTTNEPSGLQTGPSFFDPKTDAS
ncbi:hypothetical protein H0H92_012159, partial [Tricholoma furcatifolium]